MNHLNVLKRAFAITWTYRVEGAQLTQVLNLLPPLPATTPFVVNTLVPLPNLPGVNLPKLPQINVNVPQLPTQLPKLPSPSVPSPSGTTNVPSAGTGRTPGGRGGVMVTDGRASPDALVRSESGARDVRAG